MRAKIRTLRSVEQTGKEMARLVRKYHADTVSLDGMTLPQAYDVVKNIPYRADPKNVETLHRPIYVLNGQAICADCDDKSITLGAYLYRKGIPFYFIASSAKPGNPPPLHHVWIMASIQGRNIPIDPTYPHNTIFQAPKYTRLKPLTSMIVNKKIPKGGLS